MQTRPMRITITLLFIAIGLCSAAQTLKQKSKHFKKTVESPLASFSKEWNKPKYLTCNTAKNTSYLTKEEKNIIYILNLLRRYPKQFAQTVLAKYAKYDNDVWMESSDEYKTLMDTLLKMPSLKMLVPDKKIYSSAFCHASGLGATGLTGHDRKTDSCLEKRYFYGECIDYGNGNALRIVMHLMIDTGVQFVGHRLICINKYGKIGVSIQPHILYKYCSVLDFRY